MHGVYVADHDVLLPVVVEIDDQRLPRLPWLLIRADPIQPGPGRRIAERSIAVVQIEAISAAADQQHIVMSIPVHILSGDSGTGERRRYILSRFLLRIGCV